MIELILIHERNFLKVKIKIYHQSIEPITENMVKSFFLYIVG